MLPAEIIKELEKLPQDKHVLCQVVPFQVDPNRPADEPGAWNMYFEFHDMPGTDLIQLQVTHPQLKKLPHLP